MIEIIYKEEKQEGTGNEQLFSIPRNIRQIGLVVGNYRIYLEDYVYTFLGRLAEKTALSGENQGVLAVFTGESRWAEGITYVFVRGALEMEDAEAAAEHIDFTEKMWTGIQEEQELYFPDQEIVGWFYSQPGLPMESTDLFTKVHLKYFAGGEKILMLMDPTEKEDGVFVYENSFMVRQEGYYLFYERNPQMQAYMMEKLRGEPTETTREVPDEAVKAFRKIVGGKNKRQKGQPEEMEKTERPSVFSYAATACLVIAVLTVGGSFYRNYREMQSLDEKADAVSAAAEENIPAIEAGSGGSSVQGESSVQKENSLQGKSGSEGLLNEMSDFLLEGKTDVEDALNKSDSSGETSEDENKNGDGSAESAGKNSIETNTDGSREKTAGTAGEKEKESSGAVSGADAQSKSAGGTGVTSEEEMTGTAGKGSVAGATGSAGETAQRSGSGTSGGSGNTAENSGAGNTAENSGKGNNGGSAGTAGKASDSADDSAAGKSGSPDSNETVSAQSTDEETIYQEESDERKAKRRQALLEKQNSQETFSEGTHSSYVIRPGDTLYEISMEKYGTMDAISDICSLNGISRDEIIYPGQIIVLP